VAKGGGGSCGRHLPAHKPLQHPAVERRQQESRAESGRCPCVCARASWPSR
jgi:hypothetical protein